MDSVEVFRWRLSKMQYKINVAKTENTRLLNYCIAQLSTKVALPVVKLFGLVEALVKRFEWLSLDIIEANRKLFWRRLVGQIMKSAAFALAFVAAASWAVPSTLTGSLALGPLVAYLACGERFRTCATKITKSAAEMFRNVLFVQSLHDLFAVVPNFEMGSGLRTTEARGQIELRDVSSTALGANEPTIRNVSLDILPGEKSPWLAATVLAIRHSRICSLGYSMPAKEPYFSTESMCQRFPRSGTSSRPGMWAKCRALAKRSQILILAEPSANLEARAESEQFTALREIANDKTSIIVTHRLATVRSADRIVGMDEGEIVELGSHIERI